MTYSSPTCEHCLGLGVLLDVAVLVMDHNPLIILDFWRVMRQTQNGAWRWTLARYPHAPSPSNLFKEFSPAQSRHTQTSSDPNHCIPINSNGECRPTNPSPAPPDRENVQHSPREARSADILLDQMKQIYIHLPPTAHREKDPPAHFEPSPAPSNIPTFVQSHQKFISSIHLIPSPSLFSLSSHLSSCRGKKFMPSFQRIITSTKHQPSPRPSVHQRPPHSSTTFHSSHEEKKKTSHQTKKAPKTSGAEESEHSRLSRIPRLAENPTCPASQHTSGSGKERLLGGGEGDTHSSAAHRPSPSPLKNRTIKKDRKRIGCPVKRRRRGRPEKKETKSGIL